MGISAGEGGLKAEKTDILMRKITFIPVTMAKQKARSSSIGMLFLLPEPWKTGRQPKKIHMPDHLKHRLKEHQIQTVLTPKPPFPAGERISKTASRPEWTGAQRAMKKQIMNPPSF